MPDADYRDHSFLSGRRRSPLFFFKIMSRLGLLFLMLNSHFSFFQNTCFIPIFWPLFARCQSWHQLNAKPWHNQFLDTNFNFKQYCLCIHFWCTSLQLLLRCNAAHSVHTATLKVRYMHMQLPYVQNFRSQTVGYPTMTIQCYMHTVTRHVHMHVQ